MCVLRQGGGLAPMLKKQIKNAPFLFGKFGNLVFARIPFEIGRLFNLIWQFAFWSVLALKL